VAQAIAAHVHKNEHPEKGIVIGYDTRFGSRRFAEATAEVIAAHGIRVMIADDYSPTPAVSFMVKHLNASGGVVITSSHNPWNWNGVKYKAYYGGSGLPSIMQAIEKELHAGTVLPPGTPAKIEKTDLKTAYVKSLRAFVDLPKIKASGFKFAVDCMYGAGRGFIRGLFDEVGIPVVEIRNEVNPLFPGINPEPIMPHVQMLLDTTVREKCAAGIVTDGDADRIGACDENGVYVTSHFIYCVILRWLLERKKWPGICTRAYNTTKMVDRIAAKHGREVIEHGIGFKYAVEIMLKQEVLISGEESGGIGIPRHLPERDGILNGLVIANVMADENKTLGQLVAALQRDFGQHHYARLDMNIDDATKKSAIERAAKGLDKVGPFKVKSQGNLDGIKFYLETPSDPKDAEAWLLLRASGTEKMLRVYAEAASPELVQQILKAAEVFVLNK